MKAKDDVLFRSGAKDKGPAALPFQYSGASCCSAAVPRRSHREDGPGASCCLLLSPAAKEKPSGRDRIPGIREECRASGRLGRA